MTLEEKLAAAKQVLDSAKLAKERMDVAYDTVKTTCYLAQMAYNEIYIEVTGNDN